MQRLALSPHVDASKKQLEWLFEGPTPGPGCLVAGALVALEVGQQNSATAEVLYHLGVLLAGNSVAHLLFPQLPLATAHEQAVAHGDAPPATGGGG